MSGIKLVTFDAFEEFGLHYRLEKTIEYRERTREKYAHDTRNAKAIELLHALMKQTESPLAVKSLNDAIVAYNAACEGVEFDDAPPFETRVSASLGSIGFNWIPKSIDEVVEVLATDARLATEEVLDRSSR